MKFFITTFGCQQNHADSERIAAGFLCQNGKRARGYRDADCVVINTCMIRAKAEHRVYGLLKNLAAIKKERNAAEKPYKIIVTGCMVGLAFRDKTGKYLKRLQEIMPIVDEFMPIEEIGFSTQPARMDTKTALIPISNGCNNFCTFCVVPFTRGREVSRPYENIIEECKKLHADGYTSVLLLGQNVNSYGADLVQKHKQMKPVYVKHLGRMRLPTLFPHLLKEIAQMGFEHIDFMSSNPWDFSDELIAVITQNKNITRTLHLPVQSGDSGVLKRMNRWYTREEYLNLVSKIRAAVPEMKITTDIIVGFCGETENEFQQTVDLCSRVSFEKAYLAMYSPRPMTAATKALQDDIPHIIKKKRWQILEDLINKPYLERLKKANIKLKN